jgi:murein DD-endopeptidase MepM/ murein hydrolase activator NlpD
MKFYLAGAKFASRTFDFADICNMTSIPQKQPSPLLAPHYDGNNYASLDLRGISEKEHHHHVAEVFQKTGAQVLYGGYLEKRNLYSAFDHFEKSNLPVRNIHLGVDFWAPAGTTVFCPLPGKVHSFVNRNFPGDYGPVIIMEHILRDSKVYTLFGHLSVESLQGLYPGKEFDVGETIATLGAPNENGGYYPHLHFQVIRDLGKWIGDYPGVASEEELDFYKQNCPDPLGFLNFK